MKKLLAAILLTGVATIGATTAADARDGCGRGGFRGPGGHCRVYRAGPVYGGGPRLIVGRRYDRGYWDGRRYWQNRYRHHGGWRYR